MTLSAEYTELLAGRGNMYRLLAQIYQTEVDKPLYKNFKGFDYDAVKDSELEDGYKLVKRFIDSNAVDPLTDLAVDYARVFLGAGVVEKDQAANPYESVYTSNERLIMQDARDKVVAIYRRNGVDKTAELHIPEDHIAIEFEFMAHLCTQAAKSDGEGFVKLMKEQKAFIETHFMNWVPQFCNDIERYAKTDFYKGIAKITTSFLSMDLDMADEMLADYK